MTLLRWSGDLEPRDGSKVMALLRWSVDLALARVIVAVIAAGKTGYGVGISSAAGRF
jgi:hypothetical protein